MKRYSSPSEIPQPWIDPYLAANKHTPQAPMSVDTITGCAITQSVTNNQVTWEETLLAEPSEETVTKAGDALSRLHIAYGIPVIVEGFQPTPAQQRAGPKLLEDYLTVHGRPAQTDTYAVDGEFAILPRSVVADTLNNVKRGALLAAVNFADSIISGPDSGTLARTAANLDVESLERLQRTPRLAWAAEALCRLYIAGNDALYAPKALPAAQAQRNEFNLRRGGSPHVRTTDAARQLTGVVVNGVEREWRTLTHSGIVVPETTKDRFLDDLTGRKRILS